SVAELRAAAQKGNQVIAELAPDIQWIESFVVADKIFCVYLARDEEVLHEHSRRSGIPITRVMEVKRVIDPTTARG
ncbi:MAG: DUF4242 domain-containing protein, partial [Geminicoccales bacterium]